MKAFYISLLLLCVCIWPAKPALSDTSKMTVTIPNRSDSSSPCVVTLPVSQDQCTDNTCRLPLSPKGSSLRSIELNFDCLPKRSPTGFDNPPDYVKVQPLRARNSVGLLSLIDDTEGEPEEQLRDLGFCLYGEQTNFCGYAKVLRLKDGEMADATAAVKAFIEGIELRDQSKSKISK